MPETEQEPVEPDVDETEDIEAEDTDGIEEVGEFDPSDVPDEWEGGHL